MKFIIVLLVLSSQVLAKLPQLTTKLDLPAVDVEYELSKDAQILDKSRPLRFAVSTDIEDVYVLSGKSSGGQWDQLTNGSWVWRFVAEAENAKSLGFGLYDFYLPPTAELRFYDWTEELVKGPFNDQKNKPHKQLWPGPIIGNKVTVELTVADKYKDYVSFSIKNISRGYRSIWADVDLIPKNGDQKFWDTEEDFAVKSGSCNVDVACNEGNDWRNEISSVGRYTININGGTFLCTGQMINNTANDGRALFLTANHCGFNSSNDASINIWWNYESNQCRTPGSSDSGRPISTSGFNDTQSGSTFLSSFATSDFTLLELDQIPNVSYEVFYTGWDRRNMATESAVSIHHPSGHAKRISFEDDPTSITSYLQSSAGIRSHIRVADWDKGTTEGGSSGSGLWNSDKLLIGQLHGGFAACGNNRDDWYGRLFRSWTGGGSSTTRLSNWLDPGNTGEETLQGLGDCSAISATINQTSSNDVVGVQQNFSATISGGRAPYTLAWDVNADGETDGVESSLSATYSHRFVDNVTLEIVDSEGCMGSGTKAVVIEAPKIELQNTGTMAQMCGNNDAFVDPGERWQVPVTLRNNGPVAANSAYAVFTKNSTASNENIAAQDNFGNTVSSCNSQFIDISNSGTDLTLIDPNPNDNFPAQDDGVARVNLSQSFNLYGQTVNNLSLSTNGYISTSASETGVDYDNDCPIPRMPNRGNTTLARIMPLHDDLISQHIYHQHFEVCPRQSDLGNDLSCDVFMYEDVDLFSTSTVTERFSFEAILYPSVNQWVYQYDGNDFNPSSSSIGLQNNGASDGASYSCNSSNIVNTTEAVCIYHANNQLGSGGDTSGFHLETAAVSMGTLPVSAQHNDQVEFSVAENAQCGSSINIQMQAAVHAAGFNQDRSQVVNTTLGNNGACNVVTTCSPNSTNDINPTGGLWFNENRSGNGNDMYFNDNNELITFIQYTALPNRSPIWYITGAGSTQNNQSDFDLTRLSYDGPFQSSDVSIDVIGQSSTIMLDSNNAIQTRTINGNFSAELIRSFPFGGNPTEQRTGLWYNPAQSGSGFTIGTQGTTQVNISYLYDNVGQPYWVIGSGENNKAQTLNMDYFDVFCPHCPKVPNIQTSAGTLRVNYNDSNNSGVMESMQINVTNPNHTSQWNRTNMPLDLLTPQIEE